MSNFLMSSFRIPSDVLKSIDFLQCHFWWRHKIRNKHKLCLKKEKEICSPVDYGGLGLRKLKEMNELMLTELSWRLFPIPNP